MNLHFFNSWHEKRRLIQLYFSISVLSNQQMYHSKRVLLSSDHIEVQRWILDFHLEKTIIRSFNVHNFTCFTHVIWMIHLWNVVAKIFHIYLAWLSGKNVLPSSYQMRSTVEHDLWTHQNREYPENFWKHPSSSFSLDFSMNIWHLLSWSYDIKINNGNMSRIR